MPCILYMTDNMITAWADNSMNDSLPGRKCTFLQSLLLCMGMRHWGQLFSLHTSKCIYQNTLTVVTVAHDKKSKCIN